MNLYVTSESYYRIKNGFSNINAFAIIDVNLILDTLKLDMTKTYNVFLVNDEIKKLLSLYSKSKKYRGIIYITSNINENVIDNIKSLISTDEYDHSVNELILLDDYDTPKLEKYYKFVNEVMFFSTFKKIKIIECKPIEMLKRSNFN